MMATRTQLELIGKPAPVCEVEVAKASGSTSSTSLLKVGKEGQALVVDFFAPWCKACPAAAKRLEDLAADSAYAERFCFVIVCVDGGVEAAKTFAREHGISRCIVAAAVDDPPDEYAVSGLPHHMIIGSDGVVLKNYEVSLPADLDSIFSSQEPAMVPANCSSAQLHELEKSDALLAENPRRWVMFPIQYPAVWDMYKKHEASFWTAEEIDLAQDNQDWDRLTDAEQRFLKHVLASFPASDGIVLGNLASRLSTEIQVPEARAFFGFQLAMENIHSEAYSLLIEQYTKNPDEKDRVFDAIHNMPAMQAKAHWATQWTNTSRSFTERLVAFAAVKGVFFSGSFCALHWLKKRGFMPGLASSIELISRDAGLHAEFACLLYRMLKRPLPEVVAQDVIRGAVDAERDFICAALSCKLVGMDNELMTKYIEFVADRLLTALGHSKLYNAVNPFDWMEPIVFASATSMSEKNVGEFQKAGVTTQSKMAEKMSDFSLDADF